MLAGVFRTRDVSVLFLLSKAILLVPNLRGLDKLFKNSAKCQQAFTHLDEFTIHNGRIRIL